MKNTFLKFSARFSAASLVLALLTGCESAGPNTQRGAVIGGGLGALGGAIIGHQSGRSLEGMGIGAGVGILGGALVGNAMDQEAARTPPPPPPSSPPPPAPVIVAEAPPQPPVEMVTVAPGPDFVYSPGYWTWQGTWVWVPSTWVHRPRPGVVWVSGHWTRHHNGGYIWVGGYWR